eukprot:7383515-Prymnesium_polylepis.4
MLLFVVIGSGAALMWRPGPTRVALLRHGSACDALRRWVRFGQASWSQAGMRFKVKALVGFYQCIAAVPGVLNVVLPLGMEEYNRLMSLLELPSDLEKIVAPPACLGSHRMVVVLGSTWPLVAIAGCAVGFVGWELLLARRRGDSIAARIVVLAGLQRILPFALGLTFLVLPSTSSRLFKTFRCDPFEYDGNGERHYYMHAALDVSCDSAEYTATRGTAVAMLFLWPIGMPLLYVVLLWASRDAIRTGMPTPLSEATAFLWGDFSTHAFWWEPLEMCRKLVLTGGVLVFAERTELARVLLSLLVSIAFFALRLTARPLQRCATNVGTSESAGTHSQAASLVDISPAAFVCCRAEDGSLMTLMELTLILVYTCVLGIKACDLSSAACSAFGFGDSKGTLEPFSNTCTLSLVLV